MSEQTIQATPTLDVPERTAPPGRPRGAAVLLDYARRYPWVLGAAGLLLISLLVVLWARTRPGYDPYGWLVWGKLTVHLKLDTNGAPSWKPLPFLFTVPFAVVGHYALWLWMVASVAISLSGPVFAWRIAFRLTGAQPERRYASYAAGLFAGALVLAMRDPVGNYSYTHYILSAESDTMIVSLCLAAIDCQLSGRPRWAFWLWWLGALGRPEVWPFFGLYGLWLWRAVPSYRRWLAAGFALIPVLWFGIPGLTSKSFLTAGNIAENSPRAIHGNKVIGVITRFRQLYPWPVWIAAALALAMAVYRRQKAVLVITAGAALWVLIEVAFALHGWPAVPRYLFEAGAVVAVLAGLFVGRVILDVPPLITRWLRRADPTRLSARTAALLGGWGAALVVVVFAGSMLPTARTQAHLERADLTHERGRTALINRLSGVVSHLGAAHILACGQPNIPIEYQSILAWYMNVKVGELYVFRPALAKHPHPLVNMYPLPGAGWKVFTSNVDPGHTASCKGLTAVFP